MPTLPSTCPSCGESFVVARLTCCGCGTQLEGSFELPPVFRLAAEDLEFVLAFVRASGSLKEMARLRGQSYPTIRNRLNSIIAKLNANGESLEQRRVDILDAIAKGEISVEEGAKKLREIRG